MSTSVGIGHSQNRDSRLAGQEAGTAALVSLEGRRPSLVLMFATAGHDQAALLASVRAVTGEAPLSGCSAEGVITQAGSDEGSHAVAVMALASDELRFRTLAARGLSSDSRRCGRELAACIESSANSQLLLLFPDGLTVQSSELFAGLASALPRPIPVVGGGSGEMMHFERTYQYRDGELLSDGVAGVLIEGDFDAEIEVSHGCEVVGSERTVTRSEGGSVFEIDGRSAWSVVKEYLDDDAEDLDALAVSYACVAERLSPEAHGEYGPYVIRVPLRLDKSTGALFFPGELKSGAKVYMARRDPERIRKSAVRSAERLAARRAGQAPLAMLHFDCTGRGRLLFGERTSVESIDPMQRAFGKEIPWLGFHTYGEIAPVLGRMQYHNYTVVLCAIYGRDGR
jgi:hypothetical protein